MLLSIASWYLLIVKGNGQLSRRGGDEGEFGRETPTKFDCLISLPAGFRCYLWSHRSSVLLLFEGAVDESVLTCSDPHLQIVDRRSAQIGAMQNDILGGAVREGFYDSDGESGA